MIERKRVGVVLFAILILTVAYCVVGIVHETKSRAKVLENTDIIFFSAVEELDLDLSLSESNTKDCKQAAQNIIGKYDPFLVGLKEVTIHHRLDLRRGLASQDRVWIRCLKDVKEFENVLIHELGHIVAANYINSQAVDSFYSYGGVSVSTYGSEKPEEDFAESFLMYVEYGPEFRRLTLDNNDLKRKYQFFVEYVFDGYEFELDNAPKKELLGFFESNEVWPYDITVLHKR